MKKCYFAASNSSTGFVSYYKECFSGADAVYIIKGGPGTGKSGFIKKVAADAEKKGYETEYYYCSSDPDSLDGIILKKSGASLALVDGTAPHLYEQTTPGAVENIINLGEFWDSDSLAKRRGEIISLGRQKSLCFERAYDYLRSCGNLQKVADSLCRDVVDFCKMNSAVKRMVRALPKTREGKIIPALNDSVGMRGRIRLDTYEENAKQLCVVGDIYGAGGFFMRELFEELKSEGRALRIAYDPVCPDRIVALADPDFGFAFVLSDGRMRGGEEKREGFGTDVKYVNVKRFIDSEIMRERKREIKYAHEIYRSSLSGAMSCFSEIKKYHFALEEIYGAAMDFGLVDKETEKFCQKLL